VSAQDDRYAVDAQLNLAEKTSLTLDADLGRRGGLTGLFRKINSGRGANEFGRVRAVPEIGTKSCHSTPSTHYLHNFHTLSVYA
jgi:hypothetical protein